MNRNQIAPRVAWYDSPWRIAARAIAIAIVTVLVMGAAALFVVPRLVGGTSLTILSGSMEPSLMPGDAIAVRGIDEADVCTEVGVNDIVTFFAEPGSPDLITHRVVAKTIGTYPDGTECRLVVQGDNNTAVDAPISPAQVRGVFMYGVPAVGWARDWFAQNPAMIVGGFVAIALAWYAVGAIRGPKTRIVNMPGAAAPAPAPTMIAGLEAAGAWPSASQLGATQPAEAGWAVVGHNPGPQDPQPTAMDPGEYALRMRELDLREREIAIREAEAKARLAATEPTEPQLLLVP